MSSENVTPENLILSEQKKIKRWIILYGLISLLAFSHSLRASGFILFVLCSGPSVNIFLAVALSFCVPASILISIWRTWSKYKKNDYRGIRRAVIWPFLVLFILFLFDLRYFLR